MKHPVQFYQDKRHKHGSYWVSGTETEWSRDDRGKVLRDGHAMKFGVVLTAPGQGLVYGDDGRLQMHLMTNRKKVRVFGFNLPETLKDAVVGRPMKDIIDHPIFAAGTPGGEAIVKMVQQREPSPGAKGVCHGVDLVLGSITFFTKKPIIDLDDPHVPVQMWTRHGPVMEL